MALNSFVLPYHPEIWMSQASFLLEIKILPRHVCLFFSFADSFCTGVPRNSWIFI